jgi:hypothetical protein
MLPHRLLNYYCYDNNSREISHVFDANVKNSSLFKASKPVHIFESEESNKSYSVKKVLNNM